QRAVLVLPFLSLGISLCGVSTSWQGACLDRACSSTHSTWDLVLNGGMALSMMAIVLGALIWGVIRWLLMVWALAKMTGTEEEELPFPTVQALVRRCAERLQAQEPMVRVVSSELPLAWTSGWLRPRILLSTWMIEHLDQRELEAVLMHEI